MLCHYPIVFVLQVLGTVYLKKNSANTTILKRLLEWALSLVLYDLLQPQMESRDTPNILGCSNEHNEHNVPNFRLGTFYLDAVITCTGSYHQPDWDDLAPEKSLLTVFREKSVISAAESRSLQESSLALWGMWRKVSLTLIIINYASLITIKRRMLNWQEFPEPNRWHHSHLGMLRMDAFQAKGKDTGLHALEDINVGCTSSLSSSCIQPAAERLVKKPTSPLSVVINVMKKFTFFLNCLN